MRPLVVSFFTTVPVIVLVLSGDASRFSSWLGFTMSLAKGREARAGVGRLTHSWVDAFLE